MESSHERILTTHTGSLPRSPELTALLVKHEAGQLDDEAELDRAVRDAVDHVIGKQLESGIDIGNDGEQPRVGFQPYVPQRMRGFGGESKRPPAADMLQFPRFADRFAGMLNTGRPIGKIFNAPQAIAEVAYEDLAPVERECAVHQETLARQPRPFVESFMTAASPGIISTTMLNAHYPSREDYLFALSREMKKEYEYIVGQGFVLQIDAPDMAMERGILFHDKSLDEFLHYVEEFVAALNSALEGIPPDHVRLRVCYGHWNGPHTNDVELKHILPIVYGAKVGALNLSLANPRHGHEIELFRTHPLPEGMHLIPGVIDTTTSYVEHPELVAQRIERAVEMVGDRERVIAGTDCGFATFAGYEFVTEDVVWAKLAALGEGARITSQRLWGRA